VARPRPARRYRPGRASGRSEYRKRDVGLGPWALGGRNRKHCGDPVGSRPNGGGRYPASPLGEGSDTTALVIGLLAHGRPVMTEPACGACVFDESAPALAAAAAVGDLLAAGLGAIVGPVGQSPLPCLPLQTPWRAQQRAPEPAPAQDRPALLDACRGPCSMWPWWRLPHSTAANMSCRAGEYLPVSSSEDAVRVKLSQAAITRPIRAGSATTTLAARLATLPTSAVRTAALPSGRQHASPPAKWSRPPRSSRLPTTASGPPPNPGAHAGRRAYAYAGRTPSSPSASAAHTSSRHPLHPPARPRPNDRSQLRTRQPARIGFLVHSLLGHQNR
jgi:hypothetical protein